MSSFLSERRYTSTRYLEKVKIMPGDLTEQDVDAIVTMLPKSLEYRGELNRKLAQNAGYNLGVFIKNNIFAPRIGEIYAAPAFDLPCRHIFFAIMPDARNDFDRRERDLLNVCRRAMEEARNMGLRSIAFPPLASGSRGFPKKKAARLILQGISDRLESAFTDSKLEEVRIVARTEETCRIFRDRIIEMGG